ncbi:uncharacterized protein yc1106_09861 [Curvularia clavata]|uniref:Uncharacterized protein n=1 Tax=Curvularia clavata TaxID=95742 RepID=A0A9Q8ZFT1_CURCL|nr:uncharacterized protein yc1106_09861 [Curvularia clavata]
MDTTLPLRHLLRLPPSHRTALFQSTTHPHMLTCTRSLSTPRILRPSFWASMIPKPLKSLPDTPRRKDWNPATPYIILGLLVGSQAIQILWLKQERGHEVRRAEAQIGVLREVIERVQRGEKVDVEGLLGTGREGEEGWGKVLRDMQDEEALFQSKKKRRAIREAALKEEEEAASQKKEGGSQDAVRRAKMQVESVGGVKFY